MVETHFLFDVCYGCVKSYRNEAMQAIYPMVRQKTFDQSMRGTKGQKARLRCSASEMPKSVTLSGVIKSAKLLRAKSAKIWHILNSEFFVCILYHILDGNKSLQKW